MLNFFANIFGEVLNYIYKFVNNYGLSLIILSVFIRLILLPLTIKQHKSLKKQTKIQEETNKINLKYKGDPEKLNKEIFALYKREKFNPASGCLMGIVSIIILLSMFYVVSRPLTYMKKVNPEIIKQHIEKLKEEKELKNQYPEIEVINKKGKEDEKVNINMEFLGFDLCQVPNQNFKDWKVYIIPGLYIITSFAFMKIMQSLSKTKEQIAKEKEEKKIKKEQESNKDKNLEETPEEQMDNMKEMSESMMKMMPIMTIPIAIISPLGLSLYWLTSNLLQLLEKVIIHLILDKRNKEEE